MALRKPRRWLSRRMAGKWEVLAIFLALASLWPPILRWKHPFWKVFMYGMLGVMAVLFVLNVRRLWKMGHPEPPEESHEDHPSP